MKNWPLAHRADLTELLSMLVYYAQISSNKGLCTPLPNVD